MTRCGDSTGSGEAGEVTVKVKIGDAGLGFEAEVAKIDMTMGEKTQTVLPDYTFS